MSDHKKDFTTRLIAAAREKSCGFDQHQRELEQFIDRELTKRDRWTNLFIALYGLAGVSVLLFLAVRAKSFPWYPAVPAFVYLICAAMIAGGVFVHVAVAFRGRYDETDRAVKADWTMWCVVALLSTLFLWWFIHPGIQDKTYFAVGTVGILVVAVAESVRWQVRLLHRDVQVALLKTEVRLAKLMRQMANQNSSSDRDSIDLGDS